MELKDLMLTEEERQNLCDPHCLMIQDCGSLDEVCGECEMAPNPVLERAAIIKAVKEIRWAMLRPNFQEKWDALLKECNEC